MSAKQQPGLSHPISITTDMVWDGELAFSEDA